MSSSDIRILAKNGIQLPSAEFQKAGLVAVIGELQPMMEALAKEEVKKVVDDDTQQKLNLCLGQMTALVERYQAQTEATQLKWMAWGGGQKKIDAAAGNSKKLAKVQVPTASFQKAALEVVLAELRPQLESMGEEIAVRVRVIMDDLNDTKAVVEETKKKKNKALVASAAIAARSTDLKRALDQMLQELVVGRAREEVFPELTKKIEGLGLPTMELMSLVNKQAHDAAEEGLRQQVHMRLATVHRDLSISLAPKGTSVAAEPGIAQVEDSFGFLVSAGGYSLYKSTRPTPEGSILAQFASKIGGPMEHVGKIVNPAIFDEMKSKLGPIVSLLDGYTANATDIYDAWLAGGGQAQLDKAGDEDKLLAKVKVPTAEFEKAGLAAIIQQFQQEGGWRKLKAQKSLTKKRFKEVQRAVSEKQKSENMRRGIGQLLQEIAIATVRQDIYPKLDKQVSGLQLPTLGVVKKVQELVHDKLEEVTRKEVWSMMTNASNQLTQKTLPEGCSAAKEKVTSKDKIAQAVDECGFLVSEGGFKARQSSEFRIKPITLPNAQRSTDIRRGIDQLLQDMVMPVIREKILPQIERRIDDLQLPSKMLERKIRRITRDMAEEWVRKRIHRHLNGAYERMTIALHPEGLSSLVEPGEELEEDEFGFLVSEGGYEEYKRTHSAKEEEVNPAEALTELVGLAGPFAPQIKKVVDPRLIEKMQDCLKMIEPVITTYKKKSDEIKTRWFNDPVIKQKMAEATKVKKDEARQEREALRMQNDRLAADKHAAEEAEIKAKVAAEKTEMARKKKGKAVKAAKETANDAKAKADAMQSGDAKKAEMKGKLGTAAAAADEIHELEVLWPIGKFQKEALVATIESVKPLVQTLKGTNQKKALAVISSINLDDRSTDIRRKLVHVLSFAVLNPARVALNPQIEKRVNKLGIESQMVKNRLGQMVMDQLEGMLRKMIYYQFVNITAEVQKALVDPDCIPEKEEGQEQLEDEYGFLIDEGGYAKFKGNAIMAGVGDPMQLVQEIVDPSVIEQLEGYLGGMKEFLEEVEAKAMEMKEHWLEVDGGQALIDRSQARYEHELKQMREEAQAEAAANLDEEEVRLRSIWHLVDQDESGVLDKHEATQVFLAMGQNCTAAVLHDLAVI